MANPRVKSAAIFYKGKRVAVMQNANYSIKSNDTQEMADSGAYNTDGITTTELTCDTIVPVRGVGVSFVEDAINHNDVDLSVGLVDGKIHELNQARNNSCEFTSEVATGKMTGKFGWFAGAPKITG
jgi:hypothetical protein